uniref:Uncharacterized protein n=1 Tax=Cacopsylla melanoneura TaxID=428564 RepID=A0A8D8TCE7_9HEMI
MEKRTWTINIKNDNITVMNLTFMFQLKKISNLPKLLMRKKREKKIENPSEGQQETSIKNTQKQGETSQVQSSTKGSTNLVKICLKCDILFICLFYQFYSIYSVKD